MRNLININTLPKEYQKGAAVLINKLGFKVGEAGIKLALNPNGYGVRFDGKALSIGGS